MVNDPQTLVFIGSVGLLSWMLAGVISIVGYRQSFHTWRRLSTHIATGLVAVGTILEAVLLIGLASGF
ncbi:UNVERIFIED_ORG: putative membrane protein [Agrobacterium larrymoorei]|nr:putative membrane protein [Agrobacterium larrymoorei]